MSFILLQTLNSIAYGSILFMIASGFSLIFGLMRMTNMVHVVYFTMGAYIGYTVYLVSGSFILAILAAAAIISIVGLIIFKYFLFKLHENWRSQVLLCLGFLFLLDDAMLAIFGPNPQQTPTPPPFNTSITIFGTMFPLYRLVIIGFGLLVAIGLEILINKTKMGALIRSGVDDGETTRAMGVNINKLFVIVYVGGTFLAAVGGVLGSPILGMEPKMCFSMLPLALAIVIVGGQGNLKGAFFGSMIVAAVDNFGKALFPELAYFTIFMPMAIILVLKPDGLFSRKREKKARISS